MEFTYEKTDELYHHGILGQKWGVRRYQNPDGTLTDAGKKRYLNSDGTGLSEKGKSKFVKDATRYAKSNFNSSMPYSRPDEYKSTIKETIKQSNIITEDDKTKLRSLSSAYHKALDAYFDSDYLDSEQAIKDSAKAYKQTLDYFKKNESAALKEMLEKVNGDEHRLDEFHDFRKMFEGYEDEAWSKGQKEWDKTHDTKSLENDLKKAQTEYEKACKDVGQKFVGNLGDVIVSKGDKYVPSKTLNDDIADMIESLSEEWNKPASKGGN